MITDTQQTNAIIGSGQADQVAIGRAFLDNPRWAGTPLSISSWIVAAQSPVDGRAKV